MINHDFKACSCHKHTHVYGCIQFILSGTLSYKMNWNCFSLQEEIVESKFAVDKCMIQLLEINVRRFSSIFLFKFSSFYETEEITENMGSHINDQVIVYSTNSADIYTKLFDALQTCRFNSW